MPADISEIEMELARREPIFHRPEFGTSRQDFERMTAAEFWEVGASGQKYSRGFVLDTLERRERHGLAEQLRVSDFRCQQIAADIYLVTYELAQADRISRRATLWRSTPRGWEIVYHQGTIVAAGRDARADTA